MAFRVCAIVRDVTRNGGNGTAANVKTKKEADELLKAAFSGAQKGKRHWVARCSRYF